MTQAPAMPKKTLSALRKSIQHWEKNTKSERSGDLSFGPDECALCKLFYDYSCDGCPVSAATGSCSCDDTPYYAAHSSFIAWDRCDPSSPDIGQLRDDFRRDAQCEVDFLKSLLPEAST